MPQLYIMIIRYHNFFGQQTRVTATLTCTKKKIMSLLLVYMASNYVFIYKSIGPLAKTLGRIVDQDALVLVCGIIMVKIQGFSADLSWRLYPQLMSNVIVFWFKILSILDVRKPLELEIKPEILVR